MLGFTCQFDWAQGGLRLYKLSNLALSRAGVQRPIPKARTEDRQRKPTPSVELGRPPPPALRRQPPGPQAFILD